MKPIDRTITPCPRCADTHGEIWRTCCPRRLRKYSVICGECGFETKKAFTERGAIRAWSRAWQRSFLKNRRSEKQRSEDPEK